MCQSQPIWKCLTAGLSWIDGDWKQATCSMLISQFGVGTQMPLWEFSTRLDTWTVRSLISHLAIIQYFQRCMQVCNRIRKHVNFVVI